MPGLGVAEHPNLLDSKKITLDH